MPIFINNYYCNGLDTRTSYSSLILSASGITTAEEIRSKLKGTPVVVEEQSLAHSLEFHFRNAHH
jgi:hypothetical protein